METWKHSHHLSSLPSCFNKMESGAKQEEGEFPAASLSSILFSSFVALAISLYAVYVCTWSGGGWE